MLQPGSACSFPDALECLIVILGVIVLTRRLRIAAGDDPTRAAITRFRRFHGEFVIIPALLSGQNPVVVAKHDAVLGIRIRTALLDQGQRLLRFLRQSTYCNIANTSLDVRARRAFGEYGER